MGAEILDLQNRLDNALEKIDKLEIENDRLNDLLEDAESEASHTHSILTGYRYGLR